MYAATPLSNRCCFFAPQTLSKITIQKIGIVLSLIQILGGVALTLAAHGIYPVGLNALSKLGPWGYVISYGVVTVGLIVFFALWKSLRSKPLLKNSQQKSLSQATVSVKLQKNSTQRNINEKAVEAFFNSDQGKINKDLKKLEIVILDKKALEEIEMIRIISDFLKKTHGIEVEITSEIHFLVDHEQHLNDLAKQRKTTDAVHRRENAFGEQYAVEPLMERLIYTRRISEIPVSQKKKSFLFGVTSKSIFPLNDSKYSSIFGQGLWRLATGVISTSGKKGDFKTRLMHLLRLASHEFGHMRGLDHCEQYACCMQAAGTIMDSDQFPFFCSEDMAKICHLNSWTLQDGYQRQLDFFEQFQSRHGYQIDFMEQIQYLKEKCLFNS